MLLLLLCRILAGWGGEGDLESDAVQPRRRSSVAATAAAAAAAADDDDNSKLVDFKDGDADVDLAAWAWVQNFDLAGNAEE